MPSAPDVPKGNVYTPPQNTTQTTPTAKEEVSPYLVQIQDQQKKLLDMADTPLDTRTDAERFAEIKNLTTPSIPKPERPKLEETFFSLRNDYGVGELENQLTLLQDDVFAIENQLREELGIEEGKPVSLRTISGRQSETRRQALQTLDYYNRSITRVNNQLTTANNLVSTIINLKGTDYENAVAEYERETKFNLDIYAQLRGEKESDREFTLKVMTTATDLTTQLYEFEQKEIQRNEDRARSNLQIITNSITDGNVSYADLDPNTKNLIAKLEAQAGLPVGFTAKIKTPDKEIKSITSRQDASGMTYADVISVDKDGKISVESVQTGYARVPSTGGSSSKKTPEEEKAAFIDKNVKTAISILAEEDTRGAGGTKRNIDKLLSQNEVAIALDRVTALAGGDEDLGYELFKRAWTQGGYKPWSG